MLCSNVSDQLHDHHGLANPRPSEEADFPSFQEGTKQVQNFDSGNQDVCIRFLLLKSRRLSVDGPALIGLDWTCFIYWISCDVDDSSK